MSTVDATSDTGGTIYAAQDDRTGLLVTESIMLLSVLGGVGSLPLLNLSWYWIVTLAAGALTILTGIWYATRHWLRTHPAEAETEGNRRGHLLDFVRSIPQAVRSLLVRKSEDGPLLVLPRFAVLTGVLILLPTLASRWPHLHNAYLFDELQKLCVAYDERLWVQIAHRIEIFYCTPAFLVWIAGAVYYAFPILGIRPKHRPQIAGLAKSGLQALSALLLWVYLGLSIGPLEADWMFWSALILAVIGGALGIPASAGEPDNEQTSAVVKGAQPAAALKGQA